MSKHLSDISQWWGSSFPCIRIICTLALEDDDGLAHAAAWEQRDEQASYLMPVQSPSVSPGMTCSLQIGQVLADLGISNG